MKPDQLQKYRQIEGQRQAKPHDKNRLNLSTDQKAKLQAMRKADREKFRAILTPEQQAQLQSGGGWGKGEKKLNLTDEQKAKIKELRAANRNEMDAILTPDQKQQTQALRERRQAQRNVWKSLNLTADQKAKIKAIRQASQEQFKAMLNPEQQAKLKNRRHHQAGK